MNTNIGRDFQICISVPLRQHMKLTKFVIRAKYKSLVIGDLSLLLFTVFYEIFSCFWDSYLFHIVIYDIFLWYFFWDSYLFRINTLPTSSL